MTRDMSVMVDDQGWKLRVESIMSHPDFLVSLTMKRLGYQTLGNAHVFVLGGALP